MQHGIEIGLAQDLPNGLLQEIRRTLFHDKHGALAGAEARNLVRHERMRNIEHVRGKPHIAVGVRQAGHGQPPVQHIEQPALHDDAEVAILRTQRLVQLVVDDELLRRGQSPVDLVHLLAERRGRMAQALVAEGGRLRQAAR